MNEILETLGSFGIPGVHKDNNIIIPDFKEACVAISKIVDEENDRTWYRISEISRHFVLDELTMPEAISLAVFLFYIPRMRSMNEELDELMQNGYTTLLKEFNRKIEELKDNRNELMKIMSDKLMPLIEEVNKKS